MAYDKWAIQGSNLRLPPCKGEGTAKQEQTGKGLTTTPKAASPKASPCEAENHRAKGSPNDAFTISERRQEDKHEGADGNSVDPLATLAAAIAALAPGDREWLAALLKKDGTK